MREIIIEAFSDAISSPMTSETIIKKRSVAIMNAIPPIVGVPLLEICHAGPSS